MPKVNTISQALRRIKELKGKIAQVDGRMQSSVCWAEPGDTKPAYAFGALSEERKLLVDELVVLKGRLAHTNATTEISFGGKTMSVQTAVFAMAELKAEKMMLSTLLIRQGTFEEPTHDYDERGRPIYKQKMWISALDLLKRDEIVAALEKSIAEINDLVEDANHRTALATADRSAVRVE